VLYLAEVQKQRGGLLSGGSRTELKLLACQRSEQNWNTVSEETIAAEEAAKLNDGALVLVELSPNRQVQRIQEAGRPLVNILQNFSRQMEKFKLKEDEIDQWKQSLMFQVQELNRREMDMESRLEQLQELENSVERLETQKQEVETSREQIKKLQAEVERNRQELEGAWEHLRGEQRRLDDLKGDSTQSAVLDEQKSQLIADLLKRLSNGVNSTETLREDLNCAFELIEQQQATLTPHWQQLESQRNLATQQQEEVEKLSQTLRDRQTELNFLEQQIAKFQVSTVTLKNKEEFSALLKEHLRNQEDLYKQTQALMSTAGNMAVVQQVDVEACQKMPLEELQKMVQEDQEKLTQDSLFVQEQEQELNYKQESIEELQTKVPQASGEDLKNLEAELADEKVLYQMLNDSLEGQRRNLINRQKTLTQNQNILLQRQGQTVDNFPADNTVNLESIISQIEIQKQQQSKELQKIEAEISELNAYLETNEEGIDHQNFVLDEKHQEFKTIEAQLLDLQTRTYECWGRVNLYQEALQPIQDCLDSLRDKLQVISGSLTQVQEIGDSQIQTITEMRQTLQSVIPQSKLLAS
jgi:chromosome segregation ATPase